MKFFKEDVTESQKQMVISMLNFHPFTVLRHYIEYEPALKDLEQVETTLEKLKTYAVAELEDRRQT